MRLLHTSDWHLGQHFMGKNRQAEHAAFLGWLVDTVNTHRVDAVLVAGDIFDTGSPPSYAREALNDLVVALARHQVTLVLLAGNHDSPAVLAENKRLFGQLGATVIEAAAENIEAQALLLSTRAGEPGAVLCAVPFLRARELAKSEAGQSGEDKARALAGALADHYARLWAYARALAETHGGLPVVASGHLTTVGASSSESVREIYVGSLAAFPTASFPPADYIALGHIHRAQKVGGAEHIRYSGSPLALSFDEAAQDKEVLLVDLAPGEPVRVTPLAVPCFQRLLSVSGSLAVLPARLSALSRELEAGERAWVDVEVVSDDYLNDLLGRVAGMVGELPLDVLRVRRARGQASATLERTARETLSELTPAEVFARRLAAEEIDEATRLALVSRFDEVVHTLAAEDAQ
ncbi:exonuclease subunit SbcD [Crenobacter intestini]|uniref:Nuclease SbcCD subunit D n=1 Tax=Crenobacter intestini TaxID=2563443 RepID=A0A4T0V5N8_9NEIS|nr:exonuclease subunit SbcD [Crenobacter intestini]TIC86909.1 exonuclease subunit SbcD [Crenobacter intestini]